MVSKLRFFLLIIFLVAGVRPASANSFRIQYSSSDSQFEETRKQFEKNLQHAYDYVTSISSDIVDRKKCPIKIEFIDFKGKLTGFTPNPQKKCFEKILIDKKFERNWYGQSVFAHELTHLLRHQHNSYEKLWLDEGLAKLIEIQYLETWPVKLARELKDLKQISLSDDPDDYSMDGAGYVSSYFFMLYLSHRLGERNFLKGLIESDLDGWDNIEKVSADLKMRNAISIPEKYLSRQELWMHFALALTTNDPGLAPYGLSLLDYNYQNKISPVSLAAACPPGVPWTIQFVTLPKSPDEICSERLSSLWIFQNDQYKRPRKILPLSNVENWLHSNDDSVNLALEVRFDK